MSSRTRRLLAAVLVAVFAAIVLWGWLGGTPDPVARLRVVDSLGKPVPGASVRPAWLRTKKGTFQANSYGWPNRPGMPSNGPQITDAEGFVSVAYPKYIQERLETGTVGVEIEHPDYVPASAEREVVSTPPWGAPLSDWLRFASDRLQRRAFVVRPAPLVLETGGTLQLVAEESPRLPAGLRWFAQAATYETTRPNFWTNRGPGIVETRRMRPGKQQVRLVALGEEGAAWFSLTAEVDVVVSNVTTATLPMARGVVLSGRLSATVPRPVVHGRVVARIWPPESKPETNPPYWHSFGEVNADGTFHLVGLPTGDLEVVAMCQGFISTNGPGKTTMRYPQRHQLGPDGLEIEVGMEPTAGLAVEVLDDRGKPLPNVQVSAWPNVRYREWYATVIMSDCYDLGERLRNPGAAPAAAWSLPSDFTGTTDLSGHAVLPNLPADVKEIALSHPRYGVEIRKDGFGRKSREYGVKLTAGATNSIQVKLVPLSAGAIRQY